MAIRRGLAGAFRGGLQGLMGGLQYQQSREALDYRKLDDARNAMEAAAKRITETGGDETDVQRELARWKATYGNIADVEEADVLETMRGGLLDLGQRIASVEKLAGFADMPEDYVKDQLIRTGGVDPQLLEDIPRVITRPLPVTESQRRFVEAQNVTGPPGGEPAPVDRDVLSRTHQPHLPPMHPARTVTDVPLDPDPMGTVSRLRARVPIQPITPEQTPLLDERGQPAMGPSATMQEILRAQGLARQTLEAQEERAARHTALQTKSQLQANLDWQLENVSDIGRNMAALSGLEREQALLDYNAQQGAVRKNFMQTWKSEDFYKECGNEQDPEASASCQKWVESKYAKTYFDHQLEVARINVLASGRPQWINRIVPKMIDHIQTQEDYEGCVAAQETGQYEGASQFAGGKFAKCPPPGTVTQEPVIDEYTGLPEEEVQSSMLYHDAEGQIRIYSADEAETRLPGAAPATSGIPYSAYFAMQGQTPLAPGQATLMAPFYIDLWMDQERENGEIPNLNDPVKRAELMRWLQEDRQVPAEVALPSMMTKLIRENSVIRNPTGAGGTRLGYEGIENAYGGQRDFQYKP